MNNDQLIEETEEFDRDANETLTNIMDKQDFLMFGHDDLGIDLNFQIGD